MNNIRKILLIYKKLRSEEYLDNNSKYTGSDR